MKELTEEEQKEFDRIENLSPEEVRKELNAFGYTDEHINQSILRVKGMIKEHLKMKTAKVYQIFTLFNLLWKCPDCEYENNTEVDRAKEDLHLDVHGECDGCHKKFLLNTKECK